MPGPSPTVSVIMNYNVESYELFVRLARAYRVACVDESPARYRIHGSNQAGAGHADMTTERIQVIRASTAQAGSPARSARWTIGKRLFLLWCKRMLQVMRGRA